nr:transporter substrate-binding domain-containing protein [Ruegeria arenilitoris]
MISSTSTGVRRRVTSKLIVGFFAILPNALSAEEPVPVLIYDRPPYYERQDDGTFSGLVATPIQQAFQDAGIPFSWTTALFHTHLEVIRSDEHPICAAGWFQTEEREEYARFTSPIYQDQPLIVVGRSDNPQIWVATFEELISQEKVEMLAPIGFSFGSEIDQKIQKSQDIVRQVATDSLRNLKRIINGFEDFTLMPPEEYSYLINQLKGSESLLQRNFPDIPPGNTRHIICSKSFPVERIQLLNDAISHIN